MIRQPRTLGQSGAVPLIAAALLLAPGARAQSASDFRLPPAPPPTAASGTVGPVDNEHPDVAPSAGPAIAVPIPAPTVTLPRLPETIPLAPRAKALPEPAPTPEPTRAPTPRASASGAQPVPAPAVKSVPALAAEPAVPPPARVSSEAVSSEAAPSAAASSELTPSARFSWWWLAVAALAGALGTAAAFLLSLRRRAAPVEQAGQTTASRPAIAGAVANPEPAPAPPPAAPSPFALTLEPLRLGLSLVNATLHYRLRLSNVSDRALGPVTVAADMIAAHASLPDASQLARDGAPLEPRHRLAGLAPGESVELGGELRLPLAAIVPVRSGGADLLVPLVLMRIETGDLADARALVVGEAPLRPGGLLRPFRLDQGPRLFSAVGQRELAA